MPNINLESLRPYHVESTSSRLITEVKQHWALWVLGWVTTWEHRVLKTFLLIFCIYLRQFVTRGWEEWNVSAGLSKRPSKYSLIHFYKRCVSWDCVESNTGSPFFTGAKKLHLTLDWDNFEKNSVHKGAGYTGLIFIVIYY